MRYILAGVLLFWMGVVSAQVKISGTASQPAVLPLDSRIVYLGNSIVAQGYVFSTNNENHFMKGFVNWANLLSGSRFLVPYGGNKGIYGETTAGILLRLGAVLALKPSVVILEIGTNDVAGGVAEETIKANLGVIFDALRAANCQVIAVTIMPRLAGVALSAGPETVRQNINTWMKARTDIIPVDAESMNSTAYFSDGLHPNIAGAYRLGALVAPKLTPLIANQNIANTIQWDNTYVGYPLMAGTGGGLNTATGAVAAGWNLDGSNAGGATVTGSKSTIDKQVITLSGTYTGTGKKVELASYKSITATMGGEQFESIADIEFGSLSGISSIDIQTYAYNSDYSQTLINSRALYSDDPDADFPLPAGRYTLRTPISVTPAGAVNFSMYIVVTLKTAGSSSSVAGAVTVHRAGIRKIN